MQDRKPPDRRSLLRRTAGPYIKVTRCHFDYIGSTTGVPQIAADLPRRPTRQPWAHTAWAISRQIALRQNSSIRPLISDHKQCLFKIRTRRETSNHPLVQVRDWRGTFPRLVTENPASERG